jgi:hypothetical protein
VRDTQVGQALAGGEHVGQVHHRLAHAHEDGVIHRRRAPEVQGLVEDLARGQVAAELHLAGGAERAGQRAARLRGQAQRAPFVLVAHEHRLDRAPIVGAEQRFHRAVAGVGLVLERQGGERHLVGQPRAQSGGQIGHLVVAAGAACRPCPYLAGAKARLGGGSQTLGEQLEVHRATR